MSHVSNIPICESPTLTLSLTPPLAAEDLGEAYIELEQLGLEGQGAVRREVPLSNPPGGRVTLEFELR